MSDLADAAPGSLALIKRSQDTVWLVLVTAELENRRRSIAVLRGDVDRRPLPLFISKYRDDCCAVIESEARFEFDLSCEDALDNQSGNHAGALIVEGNQAFLSTALLEDFGRGAAYVDVESGAVHFGRPRGNSWSFKRWALRIKDSETDLTKTLVSYPINTTESNVE